MLVNTKIQQLTTIEDKHYSNLFRNNSDMAETLGEFSKRIRNVKRLSVQDVSDAAKRAGFKISTSYINKIENEPGVNPSYPKIQALARGLGELEAEILTVINGKPTDKQSAIKNRFELLSLKFGALKPNKRTKAEVLVEMLDRELEKMANDPD